MFPKPISTAFAGIVAANLALGGCATAGKLVGADGAKVSRASSGEDSFDDAPKTTRKVDKKARAAIDKEDILTQMTFWAREVGMHPNDREAALKFSEALRKGGSANRAVEVASAALDRNPGDKDLLRALGLALVSAGRSAEAVRPLKQLADADAKDYRARAALGVALDDQGRFDEARDAYREALAIKADDPIALTNLGVSYLLTGEAAKAEGVLRQAAALPDAGPETRQNLALAIGLQGRFSEAEQLEKVDLPPALVANNMSYIRGLLTDDRRWDDLKGVKLK
jgi:Flp pilus assembly protein TadD